MAKKAAKPKGTEEPQAEGTDSTSSHGKAISKAKAIRPMLAEGIENPSAASAEIKNRFDIDVTPRHFSATKSQMKDCVRRAISAVIPTYLLVSDAAEPKQIGEGDARLR
jgi:hypothetical protein